MISSLPQISNLAPSVNIVKNSGTALKVIGRISIIAGVIFALFLLVCFALSRRKSSEPTNLPPASSPPTATLTPPPEVIASTAAPILAPATESDNSDSKAAFKKAKENLFNTVSLVQEYRKAQNTKHTEHAGKVREFCEKNMSKELQATLNSLFEGYITLRKNPITRAIDLPVISRVVNEKFGMSFFDMDDVVMIGITDQNRPFIAISFPHKPSDELLNKYEGLDPWKCQNIFLMNPEINRVVVFAAPDLSKPNCWVQLGSDLIDHPTFFTENFTDVDGSFVESQKSGFDMIRSHITKLNEIRQKYIEDKKLASELKKLQD